MSSEGREQTQREAKARRQQRLLVLLAVAAAAWLLAWALLAVVVTASVALAIASALMLLLTTLIFIRADPRAPGREALAEAALPALTEETVVWITAQRRGVPPPALHLTNAISRLLDNLVPRLGRLDSRAFEAASVRKPVAVELLDLVEGWRSVPFSMRHVPHTDGCTLNDNLVNGLQLINLALVRAGLPVVARQQDRQFRFNQKSI